MVKALALLLASAPALMLAGCSSFGGASGDRASAPSTVFVDRPAAAGDGGIAVYLQTLRSLIEGDPVLQADVFRNVAAQADAAPTTTNRLMMALALATPSHPASNAAEAQRLLSDLLARGDALLPEEQILAL